MKRMTNHFGSHRRQLSLLEESSCDKVAALALQHGIRHAEARGAFGRYLDRLFLLKRTANHIRVYGDFIYLFNGQRLVTTFPLPHKYKSVVRKIKEMRREERVDSVAASVDQAGSGSGYHGRENLRKSPVKLGTFAANSHLSGDCHDGLSSEGVANG